MILINICKLNFFRVDWEERYKPTDDSENGWRTEDFIYLYSLLMALLIFFITVRSFSFYRMCLKASVNLHDKIFRGISRAVMYFFHTNSTGRILNRFSRDIGSIDSMLPTTLVDCLKVRSF